MTCQITLSGNKQKLALSPLNFGHCTRVIFITHREVIITLQLLLIIWIILVIFGCTSLACTAFLLLSRDSMLDLSGHILYLFFFLLLGRPLVQIGKITFDAILKCFRGIPRDSYGPTSFFGYLS